MTDDRPATVLFDALSDKEENPWVSVEVANGGYRPVLKALEEHTKQHPQNAGRAICGLCKALATERERILEARNG